MWSIIFVLLACTQCGHAVVLDRNQLATWYPEYLTETSFPIGSRNSPENITSISTGTFTGLSQLKYLSLFNSELTSLDTYIFNGLNGLQKLDLSSNHLTSLDAFIFNGLSQLQRLYLYSNNLTSLDTFIFSGAVSNKVIKPGLLFNLLYS